MTTKSSNIEKLNPKRNFGLIGQAIEYSFSQQYFTEKFENELINAKYELYSLNKIEDVISLIKEKNLSGFNVTIPFKESIIPLLDSLSDEAKKIGAVNTVQVTDEGLKGHNTDAFGFKESLKPFLKRHHQKALILGTGGASKAIKYVLDHLGVESLFVSRNPKTSGLVSYEEINENAVRFFPFIINCTPVGTYPNISEKPPLPYSFLDDKNFLYDLVYNPTETAFLKEGMLHGSQTLNGLSMLHFQAERAWEIFNYE